MQVSGLATSCLNKDLTALRANRTTKKSNCLILQWKQVQSLFLCRSIRQRARGPDCLMLASIRCDDCRTGKALRDKHDCTATLQRLNSVLVLLLACLHGRHLDISISL